MSQNNQVMEQFRSKLLGYPGKKKFFLSTRTFKNAQGRLKEKRLLKNFIKRRIEIVVVIFDASKSR
jgi:hypothetical protein